MSSDLEMDPSEVRRLLDDADTRMTRDIDASIEPSAEVSRVVKEMSLEFGLSPSWLNANGRGFIPPRDDTTTSRSANGVTVTFADARELIAMKLAASREQDLHDLGVLARQSDIIDPQALVDIAFDAYGEDSVVLTKSRDDYLIMATQALARAKKRARGR